MSSAQLVVMDNGKFGVISHSCFFAPENGTSGIQLINCGEDVVFLGAHSDGMLKIFPSA